MQLRIPGPGADLLSERLTSGLPEWEFSIPGQIVADIGLQRTAQTQADGSVSLFIEALTITE